jgi:triacylglycerol lipase
VIVTRVHPTGGIELRARQLKEMIQRSLKNIGKNGERFVLIAHSMGGLDARYMIAKLGMADQVAALLTITTPHRGSPYADWCIKNLGEKLGGLRLMKMIGLDVQAISDLTTASCRKFNREIKNVDGVQYFSISAARERKHIPAFALLSHKIIEDAEGDNDALVSVKSSTWGQHLGVWQADHFHCVNHRFKISIKPPLGSVAPLYLAAIDRVVSRMP